MLPTTAHQHGRYYPHQVRSRGNPNTAAIMTLCLVCFLLGKYVDSVMSLSLPSFRHRDVTEIRPRNALEDTAATAGSIADTETLNGVGLDERAARDAAARTEQLEKEAPKLAFAHREALPERDAQVAAPVTAPTPSIAHLPRSVEDRLTLAFQQDVRKASGNTFLSVYPYQVISWYPRAAVYANFLSPEECDHIVAIGRRRMAPSQLALKPGEKAEDQRDVRTSSGTFLSRRDDTEGILARIEERIAEITMIPSSFGEAFNLLRYVNGQHYDSHYDLFRSEDYGPQSSNRLATILMYLSDVEEGGETIFPLDGKDGVKRKEQPGFSYKSCEVGLKVKPRKGDALLFWNLNPDGTYDDHSLHGGCPTIKGEKWVMTKWVRNKGHGY